jgi:ParB family transcriptional regulator, chromosome partitioning protein
MNDNKNNQRRLSRGMSFLYGMRHKNEAKNNDLDVSEDVNESIVESQIMSDNVAQSRRPSDKDANNNVYTDLEEGEFDVSPKKSTSDSDEFVEAFDEEDELEDEELEVSQVVTEDADDESGQEEEDDGDDEEDDDNEDDEDSDIEESDLTEDSVQSANNTVAEEQEEDEEMEWEELGEEENVSNKSSNVEHREAQDDEEDDDEDYEDEADVSEEVQIQAPVETENQEEEDDDSDIEDEDSQEQDFEDEEDDSQDEALEDLTDVTQEVIHDDSLLGEVNKQGSVKSLSQRITETQAQSIEVHEFHSTASKSQDEETVLDDIDGNESSLFNTQEEHIEEEHIEEEHVEDELYADIQHEAGFAIVPINIIHPNPNQPRKEFNENDLSELTHSIINNGVLQPIIVSKFENDGKTNFKIVAGERRYRAALLAGLETMPCIVKKDKTESDLFEISIIENLQRSALNPVEEAMAYYSLASKYDYTQEQVAKAIGKTRAHIANMLRLLNLPYTVKTYLKNGDISIGHAKMLVGLANAAMLADIIVKKQLSVRELENLLKQQKKDEFHEEISRAVDSRILKPEIKSGLDSYISKFKKQGVDANFKFNAKSGSYDFTIKTKEVNRLFEVLSMLDPFES